MNIKLKNNVLLIGSSLLLLLQSYQVIRIFQGFPLLLVSKIPLYAYLILFFCGLGYYISISYMDNLHCLKESKKEKKKIITFLGIALFSELGLELAEFVVSYRAAYNQLFLLDLQIDYGIFTYLFILTCCVLFLLISWKIGYIICMQLPFYLIYYLTMSRDWLVILHKAKVMSLTLLILVVIWIVLCHRRVMLEHWKIVTRKELYCCLGIAVVLRVLMYRFHL